MDGRPGITSKTMGAISLLVGSSGEYDDYTEWVFGVYMDIADAESDCEVLKKLAGQTNNFDSNGFQAWGKLAQHDPKSVEYGRVDRPEYEVREVPFRMVKHFPQGEA